MSEMQGPMTPEVIAEILEKLQGEGFVLPYSFVAIGVNGALMAGVFAKAASGDDLDCTFSARHLPDERGVLMPVNMMFVDARGEAARVVLTGPEQPLAFSLN